jgi:hypothetical protein
LPRYSKVISTAPHLPLAEIAILSDPTSLDSTQTQPNLTLTWPASCWFASHFSRVPFCSSATDLPAVSYQPSSPPSTRCVSACLAWLYASRRLREAPRPPGERERERRRTGEVNATIGTLGAFSLTVAINPKQTHRYHCVLQRDSPAYLRVIFSLCQGTSDREFMLDCHCPAQNSACKFSPNFRENPWPRLSCRSSRGNCTNLAVLDKWVSHSGSPSLIAARQPASPPARSTLASPKGPRILLAPEP